jgi:hypothetical protein
MTIRKLESQLEQVDRAFAWILMRRFVISAGLRCVSFCPLFRRGKEVWKLTITKSSLTIRLRRNC